MCVEGTGVCEDMERWDCVGSCKCDHIHVLYNMCFKIVVALMCSKQ